MIQRTTMYVGQIHTRIYTREYGSKTFDRRKQQRLNVLRCVLSSMHSICNSFIEEEMNIVQHISGRWNERRTLKKKKKREKNSTTISRVHTYIYIQ